MSLHRRQLDPKSRRIFVAGNLCLISGLMLTRTIFVNSFGHGHPVLYFGLQFLLSAVPSVCFAGPNTAPRMRSPLLKGVPMSALDTCSLKKSLPLLIALLVVAQIDLASAYGWPNSLLSLLHLTAAPDDQCRGYLRGAGRLY